jgi:hypothetical protein
MGTIQRFGVLLAMMAVSQAQTVTLSDDPPVDSDQKKIIAQLRENALKYGAGLPDFVCSVVTRHSLDSTGTSQHWRLLDTVNEDLSYVGHKESYRVVMVNGKKTDNPAREGFSEDFGNLMSWIFDPKAQAGFQWNTWATFNDRRTYVFTYSVEQPQSQFTIGSGRGKTNAAFYGAVFGDAETANIMRITVLIKGPAKSSIRSVTVTLDYDFAKIGDQQYLLPAKSDYREQEGKNLIWNEVEYHRYRKIDAGPADQFESRKP